MRTFTVSFDKEKALTEKQTQVVILRASGMSWEEISAEMGLTERTLKTYRTNPKVKAAVRAATGDVWEQVKITLVRESLTAARTLAKLLGDPETSAREKISASKVLLEQAVRAQTQEELELRLQELESRVLKSDDEWRAELEAEEEEDEDEA